MREPLRITITDSTYPDEAIERSIVESAGAELNRSHCRTEQEVIDAARNSDAILVQWAPITRKVIEQLSRCKVIVRYGVGVDSIDLKAAQTHGIIVCNIPNYCVDEVADHTFALAMALARQIPSVDRQTREGIWKNEPPRRMPASRQMTFVTLGCGRIARAVLERAQACKFHIATCDPYLSPEAVFPENIPNLPIHQALAAADILSLHIPLTDSTRHILSARTLSLLKPTALLINTARGGLVDGVALADALDKGQLAGAGLDVFEQEPLPGNHRLRRCANVLFSSHIAWYSEFSIGELRRIAAEEAMRALSGQALQSRLV